MNQDGKNWPDVYSQNCHLLANITLYFLKVTPPASLLQGSTHPIESHGFQFSSLLLDPCQSAVFADWAPRGQIVRKNLTSHR